MGTESPLLNQLIEYRQSDLELNCESNSNLVLCDTQFPALEGKPSLKTIENYLKQLWVNLGKAKEYDQGAH